MQKAEARIILWVIVPIIWCGFGLFMQSTALQRYYLYPYLRSSIFRDAPADTTSVERYFKYTKDEKKWEILTENDLVPAVIAVPGKLAANLSSEAHRQGWDHYYAKDEALLNSGVLARFLEAEVYDGKSIWSLSWALLRPYVEYLLLFYLILIVWGNKWEILREMLACWKAHQEKKNKIQVQSPADARLLPAPSTRVLEAGRPHKPPTNAPQKAPADKPKAPSSWEPSMWLDRSKLQSSAVKDSKTD